MQTQSSHLVSRSGVCKLHKQAPIEVLAFEVSPQLYFIHLKVRSGSLGWAPCTLVQDVLNFTVRPGHELVQPFCFGMFQMRKETAYFAILLEKLFQGLHYCSFICLCTNGRKRACMQCPGVLVYGKLLLCSQHLCITTKSAGVMISILWGKRLDGQSNMLPTPGGSTAGSNRSALSCCLSYLSLTDGHLTDTCRLDCTPQCRKTYTWDCSQRECLRVCHD